MMVPVAPLSASLARFRDVISAVPPDLLFCTKSRQASTFGSMLPKVEACLDFVQNNKSGGTALITSLKRAKEALSGATGTIIRK